jgi:hypothetical protein
VRSLEGRIGLFIWGYSFAAIHLRRPLPSSLLMGSLNDDTSVGPASGPCQIRATRGPLSTQGNAAPIKAKIIRNSVLNATANIRAIWRDAGRGLSVSVGAFMCGFHPSPQMKIPRRQHRSKLIARAATGCASSGRGSFEGQTGLVQLLQIDRVRTDCREPDLGTKKTPRP